MKESSDAAGVASTSTTTASTRRRVPARESSDEQTGATTRERAKSKGKVKERSLEEEEERLAKIAELLVDGKKGHELEIAIEEWQDGRKRTVRERNISTTGVEDDHDVQPEDSSRGSNSPSSAEADFPKIPLPLTHWYKRSPSRDSPTAIENEQHESPSQQQDPDPWCWSPLITGGFHADTSGLGYGSFEGDHVPVCVYVRPCSP